MDGNRKVLDDRSEIFLNDIPRWITSYGFIALLILFISLLLFTFWFKFPSEKKYSVYISSSQSYIKVKSDDYEEIKLVSTISVDVPFSDGDLVGEIKVNESVFKEDFVVIPVSMPAFSLKNQHIDGKIVCPGTITFDDATLFFRIFNAHRL